MAANQELAIETAGLRKRYGKVVALDGVDLSVERGIVFGLLGPNGAGKTTAVRILTTLLQPDEGSASVAGIDVLRHPAQVRERIGLAGQYAAVDDNLTGSENLEMVGRLYHLGGAKARERARELLEEFDLSDAGGRLVRTYSGGMRRRLDLAAAMVARPPVLFLDEPTTGIDPRSRIALWATIEGLVAHGATVLLTTQYLDEADRLAEQLAVIDAGRVIAEGTPDELKAASGAERLEVQLSDSRAWMLRAVRSLPLSSGGRRRSRTACSQPAVAHACRRRRRGGAATRRGRRRSRGSRRRRRPTLDDVFLRSPATPPRRERSDGMTRGAVRRRHARARRAQPAADPASAGSAGRLHGSADHVRAALRLRLRRGDLDAGPRLRRLPDPGDHRPVDVLRRLRDRPRPRGGSQEGADRPLPVVADVARRGADRQDARRPRHERLQLAIMLVVGFAVGFRFATGVPRIVAGLALCLLIGYAFSWVFALIGLIASSPEAANAYGFTILFPVTFVSSAFVPVDSMPSWLQPIAEHNPFTYMVNAARSLFIGTPAGTRSGWRWSGRSGSPRVQRACGLALPPHGRNLTNTMSKD